MKTTPAALAVAVVALATTACGKQTEQGAAPPAAASTTTPATTVATTTAAAGSTARAELAPAVIYSLEADIKVRQDKARAALGADAALRIERDVFVFAGRRGSHAFEEAVALADAALLALFNERFAQRPDRAVTVLVFESRRDLEARCPARGDADRDSLLGFYSMQTRTACVDIGPGAGTIVHEIVHPILQSDFPHVPAWLYEGLASLYEKPVLPHPGEIHGAANWRLQVLKRALASSSERDETRIEKLMTLRDDAFVGERRDLHYATARFFLQWLDERGALWLFYHAWRDAYKDDPTGEKALRTAIGRAPAEVNDEWRAWVRGLSVAPK